MGGGGLEVGGGGGGGGVGAQGPRIPKFRPLLNLCSCTVVGGNYPIQELQYLTSVTGASVISKAHSNVKSILTIFLSVCIQRKYALIF